MKHVLFCGVFVGLLINQTTVAQSCCLKGDLNRDLAITPSDVPTFVDVLLDPGELSPHRLCAGDANGDGRVDGDDIDPFLRILADPTLALFDYGPPRANAEAEQIGLEMLGPSGPLLVPDAFYERIDRDLGLIRATYPALATQTHAAEWAPNQIIAKVLHGMPRDEYNCLNIYYRMTNEQFLFTSGGGWYVLTFAGNLNVERLAVIYADAPEIQFAEPNGFIGGENFWTPTPLTGGKWEWFVDDGFLDCFDGCDCHRYYTFITTDTGHVTLTNYQEQGMPWCEF
jgi:hypothetical protein